MDKRDCKPGDHVRVQLYAGQTVEATIKRIVALSKGQKYRVVFGSASALVEPDQEMK